MYIKDSDANLCTCGKVLPSDSNAAMHAFLRLYANEYVCVKKYINIRCEKSYNPYIHLHKKPLQEVCIFICTNHLPHTSAQNNNNTTKNNILINHFIKVLPHLFSKLLLCFFVLIWS